MQCSKNCSPHDAVVSLQGLIDPVADPLRTFARVYGLALRKCQASAGGMLVRHVVVSRVEICPMSLRQPKPSYRSTSIPAGRTIDDSNPDQLDLRSFSPSAFVVQAVERRSCTKTTARCRSKFSCHGKTDRRLLFLRSTVGRPPDQSASHRLLRIGTGNSAIGISRTRSSRSHSFLPSPLILNTYMDCSAW